MVFCLQNQKLQKQFQLHLNFLWKFKNQSLQHDAHAAATYLFTLVAVRGSQAQGGLGEEELGLGERSEHKDIHSLGGCKHGDHALGRGGTWTSGTGPDQDRLL